MATSQAPTRVKDVSKPRQGSGNIEVDQYLEKDATELRLERALFGDDAGFLDALNAPISSNDRALQRVREDDSEISDESQDDEDLGGLADEELFFLDAGTGDLPPAIAQELAQDDEFDSTSHRQPVWYDSDDGRITVSLANNTRLRKLRESENDDIVTGREYIRRLRRQYERLHPTPEWVNYARKRRKTTQEAQGSGSGSDSDISMANDEDAPYSVQPLAELLRSAGSLTRAEAPSSSRKRRKLRPEVLDIQRTKDVIGSGPSSIDTLQFHAKFPLLLAAGPSSTLSLYHVSPQPPNPNPLLTSLHLKNTPLHTAAFCETQTTNESEDQTRIFLSSRRRYFHTWSLSSGKITKVSRPLYGASNRKEQRTTEFFKLSPCDRYMGLISSSRKGGGSINVLSTSSMQWICSCRIDSAGGVADFDWWRDGEGFAVVGKNGEVSEYSIDAQRVLSKWWDEGSVGTTVLSIGGGDDKGRWIAVGSSSGIVNVYDRKIPEFVKLLDDNHQHLLEHSQPQANSSTHQNHRPKPARTFDQLTTPTSHLVFSSDGQMLVMASRWKKDALRLVHLPSCTVYRNWPTDKTPLGRVSSVAVSRDGALLAVGNEAGAVRLWEIRD